MAPRAKKPKTDHGDADPSPLQAKCDHLKKKALNLGLLGNEACNPDKQLGISKALAKCNGFDIVKRGASRKNRYLIIVNAQLAPAAGGRLGSLAHLDTKNPVMYLDFPLGRLKLLGTLVFPRSKHVVLRSGAGQVLLEDVFETLLVFSEAFWIGTAADNPDELPQPCPPELQAHQPHRNYHFNYGAQPKEAAGAAPPKKERGKEVLAAAAELGSPDVVAAAATRQCRPRSAVKRSYAEVDEEEEADSGPETEEEEEEHEEEEAEAEVKVKDPDPTHELPLTQEAQPARPAAVTTINLASDSEEPPPRRSAEKGGRAKPRGKAAGREAGLSSQRVLLSQDASGGGSVGRRTPRRVAGAAASKKIQMIDEGGVDDEEAEEDEQPSKDDHDDDEDFTLR